MVWRFMSREEKLVIVTNVLGLGLDAMGVRVVIHTGICDLMRQYI